jgi:hypothetical protein
MKSSLIVGALVGGASAFTSYKKNYTNSIAGHAAVFVGAGLLAGGLAHVVGMDKGSSGGNALNDGVPEIPTDEQLATSCTLDDGKPPSPEHLKKAMLLNKRFIKFKPLLAKYKSDQNIEYKAFCGGKTGIMVRKYVDNCVTDEYKIKKPIGVGQVGLEKFKDWHGISFEQFSRLGEPMVEGMLKKHLKTKEENAAKTESSKTKKTAKSSTPKLPSISAKVKAKKEAVKEVKEAKQEVKEAVQEVKQAETKVEKLKKEKAPKTTIKKAEKKVKEAKQEVKEAKQEVKEAVQEAKQAVAAAPSGGGGDAAILAMINSMSNEIKSW